MDFSDEFNTSMLLFDVGFYNMYQHKLLINFELLATQFN